MCLSEVLSNFMGFQQNANVLKILILTLIRMYTNGVTNHLLYNDAFPAPQSNR